MKVLLQNITPNAEVNIVEIARVSSSRKDKTEATEGLINYLIKNRHWSPFEHASITFDITTSKAIGIQLLRHRSFTFQEFSQRYAVVENIEPIELRQQADKNRQSSTEEFDPSIWFWSNVYRGKGVGSNEQYKDTWVDPASSFIEEHMKLTMELYKTLLQAGVAKECARMILPMATQTRIYMTGTVRSWIHFLDIRDDAHAQKEVQLIARAIKQLFVQELPIISKALGYDNPF